MQQMVHLCDKPGVPVWPMSHHGVVHEHETIAIHTFELEKHRLGRSLEFACVLPLAAGVERGGSVPIGVARGSEKCVVRKSDWAAGSTRAQWLLEGFDLGRTVHPSFSSVRRISLPTFG